MSFEDLTDQSIINFGQYKGRKLVNVPGTYLLWVYENVEGHGLLKKYIKDNLEILKQERQDEIRKRSR